MRLRRASRRRVDRPEIARQIGILAENVRQFLMRPHVERL